MSLTVVAAVCIVTAVIVLFLKGQRPEFAVVISAAAGVIILLSLLGDAVPIVNKLLALLDSSGMSVGFRVLLKVVGICYLTDFTGDLCRDFGQTSLAGKIELAGKICIVAVSLPLVETLLEIVRKIIG